MALDDDVTKMGLEQQLFDEAELAQVLKHLDDDRVMGDSQMSNIDFNARLSRNEINASVVCDELVRFGLLRKSVGISRQKKRLSVSLEGKGREEKVRIVAGEREAKSGSRFMNGFSSLFKPKEKF